MIMRAARAPETIGAISTSFSIVHFGRFSGRPAPEITASIPEETAARTRQCEEYFSDYRRYQLMQVDKVRVLLACRVIINDLLGKLYRYDYNVGYDCLLDDGNSVSRKLKKSNEEMEVEEDAPCDR